MRMPPDVLELSLLSRGVGKPLETPTVAVKDPAADPATGVLDRRA